MQRLEVSGAVRPIYGLLGVKRLNIFQIVNWGWDVLLTSACIVQWLANWI